jgi:hypothetical protein
LGSHTVKRFLALVLALIPLAADALPRGGPPALSDPFLGLANTMSVGQWKRLDTTAQVGGAGNYMNVMFRHMTTGYYNGAHNNPFPDSTTTASLAATLGCQTSAKTLQFSAPHLRKTNGKVFVGFAAGHGHSCNDIMCFDSAAAATSIVAGNGPTGWTECQAPGAYILASQNGTAQSYGGQRCPAPVVCPPPYSNEQQRTTGVGSGTSAYWHLKQNVNGVIGDLSGNPIVCTVHSYKGQVVTPTFFVTGGGGCDDSPSDVPLQAEIYNDTTNTGTLCWVTQRLSSGAQVTWEGFMILGSLAYDDNDGKLYNFTYSRLTSNNELDVWQATWPTCFNGTNPPNAVGVAWTGGKALTQCQNFGCELVLFQHPGTSCPGAGCIMDAFYNSCPNTSSTVPSQKLPCSNGNYIFLRDIEHPGSGLQAALDSAYTTATCQNAWVNGMREDLMAFSEARNRSSILAWYGDGHVYEIKVNASGTNFPCIDLGVGTGDIPVPQGAGEASGQGAIYLENSGLLITSQVDNVNDTVAVIARRIQ